MEEVRLLRLDLFYCRFYFTTLKTSMPKIVQKSFIFLLILKIYFVSQFFYKASTSYVPFRLWYISSEIGFEQITTPLIFFQMTLSLFISKKVGT